MVTTCTSFRNCVVESRRFSDPIVIDCEKKCTPSRACKVTFAELMELGYEQHRRVMTEQSYTIAEGLYRVTHETDLLTAVRQ